MRTSQYSRKRPSSDLAANHRIIQRQVSRLCCSAWPKDSFALRIGDPMLSMHTIRVLVRILRRAGAYVHSSHRPVQSKLQQPPTQSLFALSRSQPSLRLWKGGQPAKDGRRWLMVSLMVEAVQPGDGRHCSCSRDHDGQTHGRLNWSVPPKPPLSPEFLTRWQPEGLDRL